MHLRKHQDCPIRVDQLLSAELSASQGEKSCPYSLVESFWRTLAHPHTLTPRGSLRRAAVYLRELVWVPQEVREGVLDVGQHGLDARLPPAVADQAHQGHAPAAPLVLAGREQRVVKQLLDNGRAPQLLLRGAACSQDSLICSTTFQVTTRDRDTLAGQTQTCCFQLNIIQFWIDRETDDVRARPDPVCMPGKPTWQ